MGVGNIYRHDYDNVAQNSSGALCTTVSPLCSQRKAFPSG
jgi:hypothetical protein